ncbi:MAG: glycosyltransferase [Candidatus Binatia bacterium]|nr:glycosyltransferase [Candidatus Binatia bacterium]MDG2011283.1 glycosyltransferase [Candidatus Binatia bacterium]HAC78753.1 hypothetical protein [Deltaproteobacteria bacterium]
MTNWRKDLSHWLKARVHQTPRLDAWLDERLLADAANDRRRSMYLRLFPERAGRAPVLQRQGIAPTRRLTILSLVPPEDTGGGSRPARLAEEFLRDGWSIDWRWALPIFPWPSLRRPKTPHATIHHTSERVPLLPSDLVLIEAPHAEFMPLLDAMPGSPVVLYEQIDLWQDDLALGWFDADIERALMTRADFLSATSRRLAEGIKKDLTRPCAYVPNAADTDLFEIDQNRARPSDLHQGEPTLLYVGALWGDWVDLELIETLADQLPGAQIHLIGRAGERTLPRRANLHYLGEKPRESIPAYLQYADAALVPFRESAVAMAVSPLKAFEALVMGCPLVSTPIPEMLAIPEVVTAKPEAFAATVTRVSRSSPSAETLARLRAESSWARRVETILEITGLS